MNKKTPKFIIEYSSKLLNTKDLFYLTILCISLVLFVGNLFAQTNLTKISNKAVEIETYDWFIGKNWNVFNEFSDKNWKNLSLTNRQSGEIQSILLANQKFSDDQKDGFIYQITLQNNSPKKIIAVTWEYVFRNPLTGEILGTHTFNNQEQIKPNEKKDIFAFSNLPPTNVISVELLTRNQKRPYLENAVIKSVTYK